MQQKSPNAWLYSSCSSLVLRFQEGHDVMDRTVDPLRHGPLASAGAQSEDTVFIWLAAPWQNLDYLNDTSWYDLYIHNAKTDHSNESERLASNRWPNRSNTIRNLWFWCLTTVGTSYMVNLQRQSWKGTHSSSSTVPFGLPCSRLGRLITQRQGGQTCTEELAKEIQMICVLNP